MSNSSNQNPKHTAAACEQDINTYQNKTGRGRTHAGESTRESGVDTSVENKFDGAKVQYGSYASGRYIPESEGGGDLPGRGKLGRPTTDKDFEGVGGPKEKLEKQTAERSGDDGSEVYK